FIWQLIRYPVGFECSVTPVALGENCQTVCALLPSFLQLTVSMTINWRLATGSPPIAPRIIDSPIVAHATPEIVAPQRFFIRFATFFSKSILARWVNRWFVQI